MTSILEYLIIRVAVGEIYPLHQAAKLTLEDLEFDEEKVRKIWAEQRTEPRAADLYFAVLRACHMGMINPILKQFGVAYNQIFKEEDLPKFMAALKYGKELFERPLLGNGYLIRHTVAEDEKGKKPVHKMTEEEKIKKLTTKVVVPYFEFSPILFKEFLEGEEYVVDEFDSFDEAAAIYFDNLNRSNLIETVDVEEQVWKKFENIKKDQEGRLGTINKVIDNSYQKAQLIEANIPEIQALIDVWNKE